MLDPLLDDDESDGEFEAANKTLLASGCNWPSETLVVMGGLLGRRDLQIGNFSTVYFHSIFLLQVVSLPVS
jgi:hypothetical protein